MTTSPQHTQDYRYLAQVVEVHDGDTFTADLDLGINARIAGPFDLGFHLRIEHHRLILRAPLRLYGCNAAELGTLAGHAAATNLQEMLPAGTVVVAHSHKPLHPLDVDKWGARWDADVELPDKRDLVTVLAAGQWVALWDGTGPKPVPPWPRTIQD